MKISAVLITFNEEKMIEAALESVKDIAAEIIVVDSDSTDNTVEIVKKFTNRVFKRKWTNYADQKNFADSKATFPWILSLDADERLSPGLIEEIRDMLGQEPDCAAFSMPRQAYYLGKWIRHCGWYPDRKIRLFKRNKARWEGKYVHEGLVIDGEVHKLQSSIRHFSYADIRDHLKRINLFSDLAAQKLYAADKKCRWYHLSLLPGARFLKSYMIKGGFLDGFAGFVISVLDSYSIFTRYVKLKEIWKKGERIEPFPD